VSDVTIDTISGHVNGVAWVDRYTLRAQEARARAVVLCASSIESARLMLASATRQHPRGLGNSSGLLGRYLMDHTHVSGINAMMPIRDDQGPPEPNWAYIPRFRNVCQLSTDFVRGYGVQVFTLGRLCGLTVFGEMLPNPDNRVTLDPSRRDCWGRSLAHISCVHRANEEAMLRDEIDACAEILEAARFERGRFDPELSPPGLANHELGTARMGEWETIQKHRS
jgi:choline dehydrogenase-like flavoprotein